VETAADRGATERDRAPCIPAASPLATFGLAACGTTGPATDPTIRCSAPALIDTAQRQDIRRPNRRSERATHIAKFRTCAVCPLILRLADAVRGVPILATTGGRESRVPREGGLLSDDCRDSPQGESRSSRARALECSAQEPRACARRWGLVLGGSAAGEVDALDRVASSGQDPQSAIATCLISCAPRTRRREVACGVEVLIDLARDLASAHLTPGMTRRSGIRFPQAGRTTTLALALARKCQQERLGVGVCAWLRRRVAAFGVSG